VPHAGAARPLLFALAVAAPVLLAASRTEAPPEQPIEFSHRIHAQEQGMSCLYCHASARRGPVAGLPSLERCMGCHVRVAADKPEVQKLAKYWNDKQAIPWLRVHDLPDYVRFNHKRHVAASVDCRECHGDVARMEAAVRVSDLQMGFCIDCHEKRGASIDCLTCHY
jgi:hypothetical protein